MITNISMVTLLFVCINVSFCKHIHLQDSNYDEENCNVLHQTNVEENDKLKSGLTNNKNKKDNVELRESGGVEDLNKFVLRPDWKIKSSHTKSYSYEGFLPNEDSNFNDGTGLDIPNKIQKGSEDLKITQKQETCFLTIQNEIANLFYDDSDISQNIFPLCCKTEKKCKPATTKCISVMKTTPKCTQKRQNLTLEPKKAANTFRQQTTEVHHSVSKNAVVNVVIHVKCDHPEAQQHPSPNCAVLKDVSHLHLEGTTYNFSASFTDTKTTEVTKYSIFNTRGSLNEIKLDEEPCVKRYESAKPNGSPDDKLFGDQDTPKESSKDLKMKLPQPLLPHDITVPITKATYKPQTTNYPSFICQITPILCKSTSKLTKSGVLTRSVKPGLTIWKKINLPKFWKSVPITQNNGCFTTCNKVGEPKCKENIFVEHTSEENVLDRVSCDPDLDVTEDPNNCEVSESSNTDFDMPEKETCGSNLNNTEETDSEIRDEKNEFDLTFGPIPIQCDQGSSSPINGSSQTSHIEVDQTLSEPGRVDSTYLQVGTEPVQSSTECDTSVTEPYQPYLGSGQSLMEADQLRTEYVATYVTFDQPYTELTDTPKTYDELKTESGQESAQNVLTPINLQETTGQDGYLGLPSTTYDVMAILNQQNILVPSNSQTGDSGPVNVTESSLFLTTDLSENTQDLLMHVIGPSTIDDVLSSTPNFGDKSTKLSPVHPVPHDILKSTPFNNDPMNLLFDKNSEEHISTLSINRLIESEELVKDISTSASEAAVDLLKLINGSNNEITKSNHIHSNMIDSSSSTIHQDPDNTIFNISLDKEHIIPLTSTPETIMLATQTQSENTLLMSLLESYLSTTEENSYKITEGDIENIIELQNNSFLFYLNPKWFITNKNHVWNFDEGTIEMVNDTFLKMSIEHSINNNDKNKEIIRHMLGQTGTYNGSEEVPFEMFVQAILHFSDYNHDISTFEWSGLNFDLKEIIAMLRAINIGSITDDEWGSVNWMTIYRLVKESAKTTSQEQNEYSITEFDGSTRSLIVFSNGSSVWNNIKLDRSEILNIIQNVNSKTYFFKQTMYVPYKSYDPSFLSFVKHIFEQRINSNVTYSEYIWESSTYNWDELLALLLLINNTLTDINNLEVSLREHWNDILVKFRNSKRHYYTDRTVYDISFDTQMKPMTVFTNGTTVFEEKRVTLDEVTHWVGDLAVQTAGVQHIINLGGRKFQFYWNQKWYITDQMRTWSFENQTSALMNESFFGLPEDLTVSRDSFQTLLSESSYNDNFEMPFELFAQSMLTAATYSEDVHYQWSGYSFNYADILAMLRLSNFNNFDYQTVGYKWGQMNWYAVYNKVKQSSKSTSSDLQAYETLDYDGYIYPLIVFSNGTSIWKHSKLDLAESLTTLQILNRDSYFPDFISVTSFISSAGSFLNFMTEAISDRIHNKILHAFYFWKHYQFKWEDLEAMNRMLLHYYESKLESELSFSNIAVTVLNARKQVFPNRTEFLIGSENKSLIVYSNGTTEYDNVKTEFMDTVQQVEELKKSSNMVFKDDWDGEIKTLNEVGTNTTEPKGVFRGYDFSELNNNPYFNVCYPINIGGGKVQFYMKNGWFITDGENMWAFESDLTQYYLNEMVKAMNQTFTDDPHLDKIAIQNLVDNKQTLKGPEELIMPHELIIQQYLFFMKHLDYQVASKISHDIIYQRDKLHVTAVQLLMALRLSSFNNFTSKEVELPWEKGKKLNWDWFFLMGKRSERKKIMDEWTDALNASYFDEFQYAPLVIVYSNFSSDWGSQRLELDAALSKVQNANKQNSFLPVVVNGELASSNESFEWLYKEALLKRFESKRTYSMYKWLTDSLSWFDILIILRFPEAKPDAVRDNMFWKNAVKGITRALTSKYSDRIEYKVSGIDPHADVVVTIYINESTVLNDKKMDIEEYRTFL